MVEVLPALPAQCHLDGVMEGCRRSISCLVQALNAQATDRSRIPIITWQSQGWGIDDGVHR